MTRQPLMRIAFRQEGNHWNAYYTLPGSMEEAIWLGSIAMRFIIHDEKRKRAFIELMQDSVADIIQEITGARPVFPAPQPAPEEEKTRT